MKIEPSPFYSLGNNPSINYNGTRIHRPLWQVAAFLQAMGQAVLWTSQEASAANRIPVSLRLFRSTMTTGW